MFPANDDGTIGTCFHFFRKYLPTTVNPLNASFGLSLLLVVSFAPRGKGEGRGDELKRLAAVLLTSYP